MYVEKGLDMEYVIIAIEQMEYNYLNYDQIIVIGDKLREMIEGSEWFKNGIARVPAFNYLHSEVLCYQALAYQ